MFHMCQRRKQEFSLFDASLRKRKLVPHKSSIFPSPPHFSYIFRAGGEGKREITIRFGFGSTKVGRACGRRFQLRIGGSDGGADPAGPALA